LIVEVAESSLRHDLTTKAALYARHGIPEYWLIDVVNQRVLRFSLGGNGGYEEAVLIDISKPLSSKDMPDRSIDLSGLFP